MYKDTNTFGSGFDNSFNANTITNDSDPYRKAPVLFYMLRITDESGVSGTGKVVEGALMPSGRIFNTWLSEKYSISIHQDINAYRKVHMDPHLNCNTLVFINDDIRNKALLNNKGIYDTHDLEILTKEQAQLVKTKRFYLLREFNPKFKALTLGRIIEGLVFPTGEVMGEWLSPLSTVTYYPSFDNFKAVHVTPNPETNKIFWLDFEGNSLLR